MAYFDKPTGEQLIAEAAAGEDARRADLALRFHEDQASREARHESARARERLAEAEAGGPPQAPPADARGATADGGGPAEVGPHLVEASGRLVDPETGEVIEAPASEPDLVSWLQEQHALAGEQVKAWEVKRAMWARLITREMGDEKRYSGPRLRSRWVNGSTTRVARRERFDKLLEAEGLTEEQAAEVLNRAAKTFDVKALEALVEAEVLTRTQLLALVEESSRSGYLITEVQARPAAERGAA